MDVIIESLEVCTNEFKRIASEFKVFAWRRDETLPHYVYSGASQPAQGRER